MSSSVVTVGMQIPGFSEHHISYSSGKSLHDFDIIVFNPSFPWYDSEGFSSGGSALTTSGTQQVLNDIRHWNSEISNALSDGKTVYILLAENDTKTIRTGQNEYKGSRTIVGTSSVNNYSAVPGGLSPINSKGSKVKVIDSRFKQLYGVLTDYIEYEAYLSGKGTGTQIFSTVSGNNTLGSVYRMKDKSGHIVLLPYFSLEDLTSGKDDKVVWSKKGMGIGGKLMNQLLEIDKSLRKEASQTPTPDWVNDLPISEKAKQVESKIEKIEAAIKKKRAEKEIAQQDLADANSLQSLLYENGTPLEDAIEAALKIIKVK